MKLKRLIQSLLIAGAASTTVACGSIDVEQLLALAEGSDISITVPNIETVSTSLVGSVDLGISLDLGLGAIFNLLAGGGLGGVVTTNDIDIAGTEIIFLQLIPTGTICVALDDANPGGGTILVFPFAGEAELAASLNSNLFLTNPQIFDLLGGPLPFAVEFDTTLELGIAELLGFLFGGGGGGLSITQELDNIPLPDNPLLPPGTTASAILTLESVDAAPSDPLLTECDDFYASLP
ncbi:MAG: hypothetical protein MJE66_11715 [Proteobacteria bacterium]|nr:hypothetical protein [Pseudomonadota bacterium]